MTKQNILACLLMAILPQAQMTAQDRNAYEEFVRSKQQQYDNFVNERKKEYDEFRRKKNEEYAEFLRRKWTPVSADPVKPMPKEETVPPVIIKQEIKPAPAPAPRPIKQIIQAPKPAPQPAPIVPIQEFPDPKPVTPVTVAPVVQRQAFSFYGTREQVRFDKKNSIRLSGVSEKAIADAWLKLSEDGYTNMIYDCLQIREKRNLNDWAYLNMIHSIAEAVYGKDTNEATLLMAYVYCLSGYKMRLGTHADKLYMFFGSDHIIYSLSQFTINRETYYLFGPQVSNLKISNHKYPQEKNLSLVIDKEPLLDMKPVTGTKHTSPYIRDISTLVTANQNMLDFYTSYPASLIGSNVCMKWAMYANMPMPEHIKTQIYPMLRSAIRGHNQLAAANKILRFVQTGLVYEYDDKVWGNDRAFFPEESLFYPYCDCEDRSILLTRIIRDLMGLKCLLVYYPGHLAAAIEITEGNPVGDYFQMDGHRYFLADGTILGVGAPIGVTMSEMDNNKATVILLK